MPLEQRPEKKHPVGENPRPTASGGADRPARAYKPIIGLMGGIGAGKSTVARAFADLGCGVVDADSLARQALQSDTVKRQLLAWWGPAVLNDQGEVDRAAVGRLVFDNPGEKRRLEDVIHPEVARGRASLHQRFNADPNIVAIVEDCPLLLETGLDRECDALVFIEAPRAERLKRVVTGRGWDDAELRRREKNQLPLDRKRALANYVVVNDAEAEKPMTSVTRVLSLILQSFAWI